MLYLQIFAAISSTREQKRPTNSQKTSLPVLISKFSWFLYFLVVSCDMKNEFAIYLFEFQFLVFYWFIRDDVAVDISLGWQEKQRYKQLLGEFLNFGVLSSLQASQHNNFLLIEKSRGKVIPPGRQNCLSKIQQLFLLFALNLWPSVSLAQNSTETQLKLST